jgi:hypothetical protein
MQIIKTLFEKPENNQILAAIRSFANSQDLELKNENVSFEPKVYNYATSDTGCVVAFMVYQDSEDLFWDIYAEILSPEVSQLPALETENFDECRY